MMTGKPGAYMSKKIKKCNHHWVTVSQDFRKYPEVTAVYICLKCKARKTETY